MLQRSYFETVTRRINEPRKFIQIIEGPRQVGKSTLIKQVLKGISTPWVHFSADNIPATRSAWISDCWATARNRLQMEKLPEILPLWRTISTCLIKAVWCADSVNTRLTKHADATLSPNIKCTTMH